VVQQGCELSFPILLRCFAHTLQPAWPAFPARCPARVRLLRVLLGQRPSLRGTLWVLRWRWLVFVRPLRRYYPAVRLPAACMRDSWLIAFSPRPANCPRAATGSPGSRAWSFSACLGSSTPQGRVALALACAALWPSVPLDAVGSLHHTISELDTQPTDTPVQRFKCSLTAALAWLGRARAARYAFPVRLLHSLLHAGLSQRYPS
jgi:hypothetical protein